MTASRPRRLAATLAVLLAFAALAAPAASASLRDALDRALTVPGVSRAATGALAVDLRTGGVVYGLHPGRGLRPASNEKLAVALAALQELGPSYRIPTEVRARGHLDENGVWRGPLVLKGYGDPTLKGRGLATLAVRLRDAGMKAVTGRIYGDESYFDTRRTAPGWRASFYKEECPPLSALIVNRGRVGRRTVDNPALAAAAAFRAALRNAGIRVPRGARVGAPADTQAVTAIRSQPVSTIVRRMNKASDNFFAEMLMKELGAVELGRGTTAAGASVVRRTLRLRGVPLTNVRIVDGSGLSRYDLMTARALAALLISAWSDPDPALRSAFVTSLPIAGVDGTLRDRLRRPPAYGTVLAKTGTTSLSSALSGYAGTRYVFSVLMNGSPVAYWYARRGQDRFAQLLAGAQ